jgi:type III secretion system YscD/HrpQ family protein
MTERTILKILTGLQAGAEVSLTPGEYTIGSGVEDDIQFVDVSLKPGQAKLRVAPGKIEIAGAAGALITDHGLAAAAGSDAWQEIEPLDIITAGTTRFALGPANANWTTLTEASDRPQRELGRKPRRIAVAEAGALRMMSRRVAVNVAMIAAVVLATVGFGVWYWSSSGGGQLTTISERNHVEAAREILDSFPFGKTVELRREADGTIFATGYVETAIERRALLAAVEKAGIPVRFRLGVLQALRSEIEGLTAAEKLPVTSTLSPSGELTLDGVVLSDDHAERFIERVKSTIIGLNQVVSKIRTAKSLLSDIERLARMSQIDSVVVFRLDGELVEANGVLPVDKIDSWVGFLQSYSRRFGKEIGLRSFVQLQNAAAASGGDPQAIMLGSKSTGNEIVLDMERLKRGDYNAADLFAITRERPTRGPAASTAQALKVAPGKGGPARDLIDQLLKAPPSDEAARNGALRTLAQKYRPLLATAKSAMPAEACRKGSRLSRETLPIAMFWLDVLSTSTTMAVSSIDYGEQAIVLEAALEPTLVTRCLDRLGIAASSLYLDEAERNPDFVRFVTRIFQQYAMDISGADVSALRYVQTRDGQKLREGAAPDGTARLTLVGELGAAIEAKDGYAAVIYGPQLNWFVRKAPDR